ncbi:MAG TPA: Calx-beta domain-containing protein, partial [Phycisphaerae bacterium]|nr:Calx-beta domain-containing protein [Phycisphaerae bacterium]
MRTTLSCLVIASLWLLLCGANGSAAPNPTLTAIPDNTALDLGAFTPETPAGSSHNANKVTDYSGFTYDPAGHQMLLFGGGHATTHTDTVYSFNFQTLTWDSLYTPVPVSHYDVANYNSTYCAWENRSNPSITPLARHTYDMLVVPGNRGTFLVFHRGSGVSSEMTAEDVGGTAYPGSPYLPEYNVAGNSWRWIDDGANPPPSGYGNAAYEYDPVSDKVIAVASNGIWTYDPDTDSSSKVVSFSQSSMSYANDLVYFPPNQKMYYIARGSPVRVWEVTLDRTTWSNSTAVEVTGMTGTPNAQETGWAYDSANQVIGGGVNSGMFYAYDPVTKMWSSNTITADSAGGYTVGTQHFHAIDYDPVDSVFICVADGSGGRRTWAYRYQYGTVQPSVQFGQASSNGAESVTPALLAVVLAPSSADTVTVNYAVTGGTATGGGVDYTLAGGTLTFDPGVTTQNVLIAVVDDSLVESGETVEVTLSNPSIASLGVNTVHTYTINDNDALPTVAFDLTASAGAESVTPANLPVSLSASYTSTVTVDYHVTGGTATGGGVDYTLASGTLTFDPGVTTQNVLIAVVDDSLVESGETVEVTLSNPTGASLGGNTVHTYTITDNDTPPGGAVTSVVIKEMDNVSTANYPVTLSMIFKQGDVASNVTARVGAQELQTQTDVKIRWGDNSVKHALVSFVIPQVPASGQVTVDILDGGTNYNTDWVTESELLATDFEASMSLSVGGTPYTASARTLLGGIATPQYWIQGDVCSEFLIRDFGSNIEQQLNVQYYVRTYPGWSGFRVCAVVENCWTEYRGNLTYDFDLKLGNSSPVSVFGKTGFEHTFNARWHRVFWQGNEPSEIEIQYDVNYMISTKIVPNYDTSLIVPESIMAGAYSGWQSSGHDIMDNGIISTYFPATGGREDLGPYPTWAARYLLTMDNRMRDITLSCGDLSGSVPIHLRESDSLRPSYLHPINIDDRPTVWSGWWDYEWQDAEDKLPAPIGTTSSEWSVDKAHQPSLACIPYLVTGDFYYLEEMYFWASWDLSDSNHTYRYDDLGIFRDQVRGDAWAIRNVADPANLAPDDHVFDKTYYTNKTNSNLTWWYDHYVVNGNYPAIKYWGRQSNWGSDGGSADGSLETSCRYYTSPWMDDFVLMILGHMRDIGFASSGLVDWWADSIINRFSHPDFNPYRGAAYHAPTEYDDGQGGGIPYATWLDVNNAWVDDVGPSDFANPDYPTSYNYIARCAMTFVTHMPNGQATWDWLDNALYSKSALNDDPTFAFLPRTFVADTTAPAAVTDLAAGNPTSASIDLAWTAPGDDGSTGTAQSYDVRYSTSAITEGNWASATQVSGEPAPMPAGTAQGVTVSGLSPGTTYYFAMKTSDEVPNVSGLSNVPNETTTAPDTTAPAAVTDLATSNPTGGSIDLGWTAPGDDGSSGTASSYDIRYSTSSIDEGNWGSAIQVSGEPSPAVAGTPQGMTVSGLNLETTYYFALKTADEVPNISSLSNVASGTTAQAAEFTVTFQNGVSPDASYAGCDDNWIYDLYPDLNYGNNDWGNGVGFYASGVKRSLIKFDVSAIPTTVTVMSAKLQIMIEKADGTKTIEAYQVYRPWTRTGSTWNNYDGGSLWASAGCSDTTVDRSGVLAGSVVIASGDVGQWKEIDLDAGLVQGWVAGTNPNNGVLLKAVDEAALEIRYRAENYTTVGERPKLVVTYMDQAPELPVVGFDLAASSGDESVTPANLAVSLSAAYVQTVTVDYAVTGGTATGGGVDYTLAAGTLTFDPNDISKTVAITIVNDGLVEADETIQVTLSNPTNATLGTNTVHTYTILDNDVQPGDGTGLTGDYYDNIDFTAFVLSRVDATVNFNWGSGSPDPSIGVDTFSVRWTGQVQPLYSQTYTFYTNTDDGVRLWVDNQLVIDQWVDQGPTEVSGTITLSAGVKYDIEMEYYENGGGAVAELRWSSASQTKEIIPQTQLYPAAAMPTVQFDLTASSGAESVTPASLSVSLSAAYAQTVTVDYAVTGGTATGGGVDYTLAAGTLTFDPNDVSKTIAITIVEDGLVEA